VKFTIFFPGRKVVWTTANFKEQRSWLRLKAFRPGISEVLTTTDFVKWIYDFLPTTRVVRRGINRKFELPKAGLKSRVMFWRDSSRENDLDLHCLFARDWRVGI
jgi:hypothetical protein